MKKIILVCAFLFVGCAMMLKTGSVSISTSDYDGTKSVYLEPGWANNDMSGSMLIGARKNSKLDKDYAILIVRNNRIKNFASNYPNFYVKIGDSETRLSPISKGTDCEVSTSSDGAHCTQEYLVKITFIEEMITGGENTKFKLILRDAYTEGSLRHEGMTTAKTGLIDFIKKIKDEI